MFARFSSARKTIARFIAMTTLLWLAACDVTLDPNADVGQPIDPSDPIEVALLVPGGSAQETPTKPLFLPHKRLAKARKSLLARSMAKPQMPPVWQLPGAT